MRYEIRELGVGGILDQAIQLTKNHFGLLFLITLVAFVPLTAVQTYLNATLERVQLEPGASPAEMRAAFEEANAANQGRTPVILLLASLAFLVVYPLTNAAIIHAIASSYLGKPTSVGDAFARAFRVFLPLIWTVILTYLAIVGGMILLIIPGIIASFYFFLTTQVVVIEGVSGFAALKRSAKLVKGNVGTEFVLLIILFVIQVGLALIANVLPQPLLAAILNALVSGVTFIFMSAVWVVFYFSCRSKAENFDLAMLAEAIEAEEPAAQPARA